jgi:hypothetical protein
MLGATNDGDRYTAAEKRSARVYRTELLGATLLYAVLLITSLRTVDHASGGLKMLLAGLPALGAAAMAFAIVRFALRMDELQRRTLVDAAAIAAIVTAVVTLTLGFLENGGLPRIAMTWVWPIALVSWGIALPFCRRQYR